MTMKLLDPTGNPVAQVESDVKKAHEPREFRRKKAELDTLFTNLLQEFLTDMAPAEGPNAAGPDFEAVRKHYGHRWAEAAHGAMRGSLPITVDDQSMYQAIDEWKRQRDQQRNLATPLNELVDLTPFDFKFVGRGVMGDVWMCSACVLAIDAGGLVRLRLRLINDEAYQHHADRWLSDWGVHLERVGMTMGELFDLLKALFITRIAPPTEEELAISRGAYDPE